MNRVEESSSRNYLLNEFKQLKTWQKAAALAVVTFASIFSCGLFFEPSLKFMIGRFRKPDADHTKKVIKVDLTKKRPALSVEEKKKIEKDFDSWFRDQPSSRFEERGIRKKALKLAAFYVLENKKDDNIKFALVDILEDRFKQEEELKRIANSKPSSPLIPSTKKSEEPKTFVIKTERKNSEGEVVVVQKEYKRWKTAGAGSCAFHALLGEPKNGVITADLKKRKEFCDYLRGMELPVYFTTQIEEVFFKLSLIDDKRVVELIDVLKPLFEKGYKKDKGYKFEIQPVVKRLSELNKKDNLSQDDRNEIEELHKRKDAIQEKFFNDAEVKAACIKKMKALKIDCSENNFIDEACKAGILFDEVFEKLNRSRSSDNISGDGRIRDYIKALNPIYEKDYKIEMQSILKGLAAFEGVNPKNLEQTAAEARKALYKQSDALKEKFVADPRVKEACIQKLSETGNELFQHELVELAKKEKIPLVLHQKESDGAEITTKYIDGEIVPNNKTYKDKDPASKKKWVHVYYEGSHYERVTKLKVDIDLKEKK